MKLKLNISLIDKIIKQLQDEPDSFDQREYGTDDHLFPHPARCKAPCCIAGWAIMLGIPPEERETYGTVFPGIHGLAGYLLGINAGVADMLFAEYWGKDWIGRKGEPTAEEAIDVLTKLKKGELEIPFHLQY